MPSLSPTDPQSQRLTVCYCTVLNGALQFLYISGRNKHHHFEYYCMESVYISVFLFSDDDTLKVPVLFRLLLRFVQKWGMVFVTRGRWSVPWYILGERLLAGTQSLGERERRPARDWMF